MSEKEGKENHKPVKFNAKEVIRSTASGIVSNAINSVILKLKPELTAKYPDFPKNAPPELLFKPKKEPEQEVKKFVLVKPKEVKSKKSNEENCKTEFKVEASEELPKTRNCSVVVRKLDHKDLNLLEYFETFGGDWADKENEKRFKAQVLEKRNPGNITQRKTTHNVKYDEEGLEKLAQQREEKLEPIKKRQPIRKARNRAKYIPDKLETLLKNPPMDTSTKVQPEPEVKPSSDDPLFKMPAIPKKRARTCSPKIKLPVTPRAKRARSEKSNAALVRTMTPAPGKSPKTSQKGAPKTENAEKKAKKSPVERKAAKKAVNGKIPQEESPKITKSDSPASKVPPKAPRKKSGNLSDTESGTSSEDENEDEQTKFAKLLEMKEVPENVTVPIGVKPATNIKLLKESFDKTKDFDQAMKDFTSTRKVIPPAPKPVPQVIPPPLTDPSNRTKKRKQPPKPEEHPEAHLGGIFTINNGWDKPIPKKEPEIKEMPKMIPREQRFLPKITLISSGLLHDHHQFEEDHRGMCGPELNLPDNFKEELNFMRPNNRSIFDPDADETDDKENVKSPKKIEKVEEKIKIVPENKVNENEAPAYINQSDYACDDEEIMLFDDDNLDDLLDDDEPPIIKEVAKSPPKEDVVMEVVDTRLKIRFVKPKSPSPEPEIEKNHEIFAIDPESDDIIKKVFGGGCPSWLDYKCYNRKCSRPHAMLDDALAHKMLITTPDEYTKQAYDVCVRLPRLFKTYIPVFAHIFGFRKDEQQLIQLVKDCEAHPRLYSCYRPLINQMVGSLFRDHFGAIQFLIKHHDYSIDATRDVIINLILELPDHHIPRFGGYINHVLSKQSLEIKKVNRLLAACNEYTSQTFPLGLLNHLITMSTSELAQLNEREISSFIKNQNAFFESFNQKMYETKLLGFLQKLYDSHEKKELKQNIEKRPLQPYQVFNK